MTRREESSTVWSGGGGLPSRAWRRLSGNLRWSGQTLSAGSRRFTGHCELGARSRLRTAGAGRMRLGTDVVVAPDFEAYIQGDLIIGDRVYIGRWGLISVFDHVSIGSDVRLGERVSIHDENHASTGHDYRTAPVVIEDEVWIGANVVVLPGVTIGKGAVVGAGSVVTRSIPPGVVAGGVPARVVTRH